MWKLSVSFPFPGTGSLARDHSGLKAKNFSLLSPSLTGSKRHTRCFLTSGTALFLRVSSNYWFPLPVVADGRLWTQWWTVGVFHWYWGRITAFPKLWSFGLFLNFFLFFLSDMHWRTANGRKRQNWRHTVFSCSFECILDNLCGCRKPHGPQVAWF